ncbi:unnamed protein product [Boreogadus saida]
MNMPCPGVIPSPDDNGPIRDCRLIGGKALEPVILRPLLHLHCDHGDCDTAVLLPMEARGPKQLLGLLAFSRRAWSGDQGGGVCWLQPRALLVSPVLLLLAHDDVVCLRGLLFFSIVTHLLHPPSALTRCAWK